MRTLKSNYGHNQKEFVIDPAAYAWDPVMQAAAQEYIDTNHGGAIAIIRLDVYLTAIPHALIRCYMRRLGMLK